MESGRLELGGGVEGGLGKWGWGVMVGELEFGGGVRGD